MYSIESIWETKSHPSRNPSGNEAEKPRFAQLNKGQSIATITLEEALGLFKLPRTLGEFEGEAVTVGTGRFGPYVLHSKKYVSIPKDVDPMKIELEEAVRLIEERRKGEAASHLKSFAEDAEFSFSTTNWTFIFFTSDITM